MSHYDITQWVDYARGLLPPSTTAAMDAHLQAGCRACANTARRMALVATVAAEDARVEPPAHLLQFARAAFSLRRPDRLLSLPSLVARVIFNTLDSPDLPGVPHGVPIPGTRGPAEEISRQTLFEAGDYSVHLRFEQLARVARVSLVGQIANRRTPEPPLAHVPVLLTRGRTVVARSMSNEFGEFQVEYEPHVALQLHIPVAQGRQQIRLALTDLNSPGRVAERPRTARHRRSARPLPGRRP